jgi:hypothetical protein
MNQFTRDELMEIISSETNNVWNGDPAYSLIDYVKQQIESTGQPLSQEQVNALTNALVYISKASTKNTLVATVNLLVKLGLLQENQN